MPPRLTFHLILHTHWDREWYLPQAGFLPRLVAATGAVLDLLKCDDAARFVFDGQTVLLDDVLQVQPDWSARIAQQVMRGALEVGPWFVLGDELIPSGESMIRNLLQGARDTAALGGRMDVLYSPDAFGHPAIFPALAREFGIGAAVVWRGLGRPTGVDRDLYRWRAPDGADVLLYHLPAQGYEIGADLTGPAAPLAERWRAIRSQLVERSTTSHIAVFVGADHHAPPRDPGALCEALRRIEPDHDVRMSSLAEYFSTAGPEASAVPALEGELRWSYGYTWSLQGTFGTRARLKRRHGAVELYMQRMVEPLAALAASRSGRDRRGVLRTATRMLLKSQFHDTLCGCCSDDVAREQGTRLTSIGTMTREIARAATHEISSHDPDIAREYPERISPALLLWNPVPRTRSGIVTAEVTCFRRDIVIGPPAGRIPRVDQGFQPFVLTATDGARIPVQVLSITPGTERIDAARHYPDQDEVDRAVIAFEAPPVPGLGFLGLTPTADTTTPAASGLDVRDGRMANRFLEVHLAPDGRIDLIDRREGEHYLDVLRLVDEPDLGDTYTPMIPADTAIATSIRYLRDCTLATGPLVGAIERRFTMRSAGHGDVGGRLVLVLHADTPVLRVRLEIDNRATDHRLRLRFPVGIGSATIAGAAFGFERRESSIAQDAPFAGETPMATAPAHRYVAAGGEGRGLAVFCPGLFEYEWSDAHDLMVTVLRSVGELSRDSLAARPGHAGWPMPTPEAQEPGMHAIELGVTPLAAADLEDPAALEQSWEETFVALQPTFVRDFTGDLTATQSVGVRLEGTGLIFSALKPAEAGSGLVLRCYNSGPAAVKGRWTFRAPIERAVMARADETPAGAVEVADSRIIDFEAPARGLVTVLVYPRG
jgi:alpha-mannosidase